MTKNVFPFSRYIKDTLSIMKIGSINDYKIIHVEHWKKKLCRLLFWFEPKTRFLLGCEDIHWDEYKTEINFVPFVATPRLAL